MLQDFINEAKFAEENEFREKYIDRIEVLGKVKNFFLIPELEVMTTQMVADYFEVDFETIKKIYQRNKNEISADGVFSKKSAEIIKFFQGHHVPEEKTQGRTVYVVDNVRINIPNAGTKVFSKRAILRIAMLLRDSEVAKEIRTQLLNTFEKVEPAQKIRSIDVEEKLLMNIARAYVDENLEKFAVANQEYIAYQNRYIKQIEEEKDLIQQDNHILAGEILSWSNRACINKACRMFAGRIGKTTGSVFHELYNELRYKHKIGLSQRGKSPLIQHIRENEWPVVIQTFTALCDKYNVNATSILSFAKISDDTK